MNKTQVKKLLVAERKSMRIKQKQSAFLRKTNSIYQGMKKRAHEAGIDLNFTIEDLRGAIEKQLGRKCRYCGSVPVTVANMAVDHKQPLARGGSHLKHNLLLCCKSCNWQKGILCADEFDDLLLAIGRMVPEARMDIKRRLTIGGKWGVRVG
jgi:5-methylcytosine-specific restriction endonuclease McrA